MPTGSSRSAGPTYEVDENPPWQRTVGTGFQYSLLSLSIIALNPAIVFRAAGEAEATVNWVVFASMLICGFGIVLQARKWGRIGAGYVLSVAPTSLFIAVSIDALKAGGIIMLAALTVTAALVQFVFALKMSMFRRLLTPPLLGTVMMLLSVTIMPVIFGLYDDVPVGYPASAGPACVGVTVLVIGGILLKGSPGIRVWAPLIGIVSGSLVALWYGLYDVERVAQAGWLGVPTQWPMHFVTGWVTFDVEIYLGLAPAFLLLFLVAGIRVMAAALAIQTVSRRTPLVPDFRVAQGAVYTVVLANMAAGLAGTMPKTTDSGTIGRTQLTGVASSSVGVVFGSGVILVAFCPKIVSLILAIPAPVFAGFVTAMIANIFTIGLKMAVSDGVDHRFGLIIGLSFWIGVGCQYGFLFPDFLNAFAAGTFKNALTTGGLTALFLTAVLEVTKPRRQKLVIRLERTALPTLKEFAGGLAERYEWSEQMSERFDSAVEESLLTLLGEDDDEAEVGTRQLVVTAQGERRGVELEFIAGSGQENIENRLALLSDTASEESVERDVSLRLLRHLASEVKHRQYHDLDILTVRIDEPDD